MDDFDRAVLCNYNASVPEDVKLKAIEYCNNVQQSPDGWKLCLDKFFKSSHVEVKFFSLVVIQDTILHKFTILSEKDTATLKSSLMNWLQEYIPKNANEDTAIKNKFAQTVATLFRQEYPERWPNFFAELFSTLQKGTSLIDMFLRIMKSIDQEVISKAQRNTIDLATSNAIKDAMRVQVVQDLCNAWFQILETYQTSNPDLCKDCLDNIGRYISWMDISLIANDRFIPLFYKFLTNEQLRESVCECLFEIINKGMADPLAKLGLLSQLKITQVLANVSMDDEGDFLDAAAKLLNTVGSELVACQSKVDTLVAQQQIPMETATSARSMLEEALSLLFKFLNNEDDDVSLATIDFALAYLNSLKNSELTPQQTKHLEAFLTTIRSKMKYEPDWNFDEKDEEEADFANFRKQLSHLFQLVTKLNPQLVAAFVHSSMEAVIANQASASFADVEVVLTLFCAMGDGISGTATDLEPFFAQEIVFVASSNLSTYPHYIVTLTYFDAIVRFAKYLPENPEAIKQILMSFLDGRGLRHPMQIVRSRSCYLFQRFVKAQLTAVGPFLDSILVSIKDFLGVSFDIRQVVGWDDQVDIFDAVGILVGQTSPPERKEQNTRGVVQPLLAQMNEIISKELYKSDTPEQPVFTTFLVQIITAIGTFSKGFNGQRMEIFKDGLKAVIQCLELLPNHEEIRSKAIFYMHRMIACLEDEVLEFIPLILGRLMSNSQPKDLIDFIRLINQLMIQFKEKMAPVIDSLLIKLIERLFGVISELSQVTPNVTAPKSEAEREILEVQKNYYLLLSTMLSNNLTAVLAKQSSLSDILKTVLGGCVEYRDMNIPKQCFTILSKLVEQWAGEGQPFTKFVYEEIAPLLIREPFKADFNLNDGGTNVVMHANVQLQKTIFEKCGKHFTNYLRAVLFPALQWPPQLAEEYIVALETATPKQFRAFLKQLASGKKT